MDDDDNQDDSMSDKASHSKGRDAALWAISDDSDDDDDDDDDESENEESESSDEEDECHQEGEEEADDGEEVNEELDDEEEDENPPVDCAVDGTSAEMRLMSSDDDDADACPICLNSFNSQPVATPENCVHYFCLDCILEWAKNANSCPVDRIAFNNIYLRKCYGGKVKKMITVQKPVKEGVEEVVDLELEQTNCEVCGGSDREDRLLLCDGCDAGFHMECLTPPLDSVPVEEWFCPECEANSRRTRDSSDEVSETESLPSAARPATSHHQHRATGPTRAIARTQQSERVRASVNRHRITQARTSQLTPTYLTGSTWLDETINAVVAGLNTSVYIRDLTPRVPVRRKRKTGKSRKVKRRKTPSTKGKSATNGFKRRKYKRRKTKSRKKLVSKKVATSRSRIANSLGMVKDKRNSSVPTVYRPSEYTLSSMRADIGAASLSIYGDPSDFDPFVDRENEEQQAQVSSALEAKRRGISHSALRSHQPVARPVVASLSRRVTDVPRSLGVVEAAPVPDLLGSILSGQNMLLMDSSDVVISRDGSLKTSKTTMSSTVNQSCSNSSDTGEINNNPGILPSLNIDNSSSLHYNPHLPGSCHSSLNRPLLPRSADLPPCTPSSALHTQPSLCNDLPHRSHPDLQPPCSNRSTVSHWRTNDIRASREISLSSIHAKSGLNTKGVSQSQSQPKKAPTKPMWVDVSELPRIPKIKRERGVETNYDSSQDGSFEGSSISSTTRDNGYGMAEMGINGLAGDKSKQQSVDQQKNRVERNQHNGAGSSSNFSNSFSSSSSTGLPMESWHASSSSAIRFRINSSGNSWQSRQLSIASTSDIGGSRKEHWREKEEAAKKRQLHRDKQMLLASRVLVNKAQDCNDIYDPCNPTLSDSSNSDSETESFRLGKISSLGTKGDLKQNKQHPSHVKMETQETEVSWQELKRANTQKTIMQEASCSLNNFKVEKQSRLIDIKVEKRISTLGSVVKIEQSLDVEETERCCSGKAVLKSERANISVATHHSPDVVKHETVIGESAQKKISQHIAHPNCKRDSSATSSAPTNEKRTVESKSGSTSYSKPPSRDHVQKKISKSVKKERARSLEMDKCGRGDHRAPGQSPGKREEETVKENTSISSMSREMRRACSIPRSSQSNSPEHRSSRKRRRDVSPSKDKRRHRSISSSSSSEDPKRKKHQPRSNKTNDDRGRDNKRGNMPKDKRHGCSRSRSRSRSKDDEHGLSRSKSRSRSRERRKDHTQQQQPSHSSDKVVPLSKDKRSSRDEVASQSKDKRRHMSRSSSLERRKTAGSSSESLQKPTSVSSVSSSKSMGQIQDRKKEKDVFKNFLKDEKTPKWDKVLSKSTPSVKIECKDFSTDLKEIKIEKQQSLDMFDDFPVAQSIKKEETDLCPLQETKSRIKVEIKEDFSKNPMFDVKTETCEFIIKSELDSPKVAPFSTSTSTPVVADNHHDTACAGLTGSQKQHISWLPITVKQEPQETQPSDSDDDFGVDVMLDSLNYVNSEGIQESKVFVKDENEKDGKKEEDQVSAGIGAKSKTLVKRVTWNIQEPEGPQPEKSASKVALYKLKIKQEGVRRPSSVGQDIVSELPQKGAVIQMSTFSRSDAHYLEDLPMTGQGATGEGVMLRKDAYLKKLHMQERAVEEVKLAIKPFYQKRDINKDEYKEILRKAVQKVCHSKSGEINPVRVGILVKAYVDKYKHARKHKKGEDVGKAPDV